MPGSTWSADNGHAGEAEKSACRARRSASARAKAGSARTPGGHPAHSFADLIAELGTLCRNEIRIGQAEHTYTRLTKPSALQARAFELLGVKLA